MSDQVDATNRILRDGGVLPPAPEQHESPSAMRPELQRIRLPGRNRTIADFAKDVGQVMCHNGIYLRGEVPMVLNKTEKKLKEMSASAFRSYVDNHAVLFYYEAAGKDEPPREVRVSMPKDIAGDTLRSYNFLDQQRPIRRINVVPMPIMRADGRVDLLREGYDWDSKVLSIASGLPEYELMPVEEAKRVVMEFFKGFDFEGKDAETGLSRSMNAHVAGMLTPFCLGLLSPLALVPMFIYTANTRRGGKTLLVKSILYTCYGTAPASSFGKDEEELRKILDTKALSAASYIFFDNVKRKISSGFLEAFLTQPTWGGRTMATQKDFGVDKQTIVYVTSNHVRTSDDIAGRALFVDLFVETTDVQAREFPVVIDDTHLMQPSVRHSLLSAMWSMVKHWEAMGRPVGKKKLVSFEEWSRVIGGIVMAAGFGDPIEPPKLVFGNTDGAEMIELVTELATELAQDETMQMVEHKMDRIVEICVEKDLFVDKIDGKWIHPKEDPPYYEMKKSSSIQFGQLLKEYIGRTFDVPGVGKVFFGRRGSKNWRRFQIERAK